MKRIRRVYTGSPGQREKGANQGTPVARSADKHDNYSQLLQDTIFVFGNLMLVYGNPIAYTFLKGIHIVVRLLMSGGGV
jgi:hypothetical protein